MAFNHVSHASFGNAKIQETLSIRIFTKISRTLAGCSFCGVYGNSCPSSVILSLSQGKNQRSDFNKMILFTLNVYCAIETFLHISDVSTGNLVQLCY